MGNNQDGAPGRAFPSDDWSILPGFPRGHISQHLTRLPHIDHQVAGQDFAPLLAQRDAEPRHLHRHDRQCPAGIRQQVLLQKRILGNQL